MKTQHSNTWIAVSVALAFCLVSFVTRAETFTKGSPVQILTKDKAVAGKLQTDSNAKVVKLATNDKKTVTIPQEEIKEVRLLRSSDPKGLKGKVEETRTRGSSDFTGQLASAFESFFTDKDVRKSNGTLTSFGQVVLDQIHPTATFTRAKIHDVKLTYRGETPPKEWKDVQRIDLRLTLYWKGLGIITDDGWTKVAVSYDSEVGRWTKMDIIETNGVTNKQVIGTVVEAGLTALIYWLSGGDN